MSESNIEGKQSAFNPADITALSHLYRGELYRSTVWRTRLDATTNWAVLTTGIALSLTFSSESASPLPLVLVGLLVTTFLFIEARRYRFFDFWRMRAHVLEVYFFGPILRGEGAQVENGWNEILYQDYRACLLCPHERKSRVRFSPGSLHSRQLYGRNSYSAKAKYGARIGRPSDKPVAPSASARPLRCFVYWPDREGVT